MLDFLSLIGQLCAQLLVTSYHWTPGPEITHIWVAEVVAERGTERSKFYHLVYYPGAANSAIANETIWNS